MNRVSCDGSFTMNHLQCASAIYKSSIIYNRRFFSRCGRHLFDRKCARKWERSRFGISFGWKKLKLCKKFCKKSEKWNQWGIRKCQIWNLSFLLAAQIWNCAKTGHHLLNRKCACTNRQENNCSIWIVAENLHCYDLYLMMYLQNGAWIELYKNVLYMGMETI